MREAKILVVDSLRLDLIAVSKGCKAFLSSMKSPKLLSSSSPTGVSRETGSLEISIEDLEEFEIQKSQSQFEGTSKIGKIIQKLQKFEERFQMFQVLY